MQNHPSYPVLSALLPKYPRTAGALFQTYNDLLLAQEWTDIELVELAQCARGAIRGRKPRTEGTEPLCVVPCSLSESLSTAWLEAAFAGLGRPAEMYLAIASDDASIVYYKISNGIVKPPV